MKGIGFSQNFRRVLSKNNFAKGFHERINEMLRYFNGYFFSRKNDFGDDLVTFFYEEILKVEFEEGEGKKIFYVVET